MAVPTIREDAIKVAKVLGLETLHEAQAVRLGALAIALALLDVADALRELKATPPKERS